MLKSSKVHTAQREVAAHFLCHFRQHGKFKAQGMNGYKWQRVSFGQVTF